MRSGSVRRCVVALAASIALVLAPAAATGQPLSNGVASGSAAVGAMMATDGSFQQTGPEVDGRQLNDWVDPRTGLASRLAVGCGHVIEATLSRTGLRNNLNLTVSNVGRVRSTLVARDVFAHFGGGQTRQLPVPYRTSADDSTIVPGRWVHRAFTFPDKADFRGQDSVEIDVPLGLEGGSVCTGHVRFERLPGVPDDPRSTNEYNVLEAYFDAGVHFAAFGNIDRIAHDTGVAVDFGFAGYRYLNSGWTLDVLIEGYGGRGVSAADPNATGSQSISSTAFVVGYVLRASPFRWLTLSYNIAAGPAAFEMRPDGNTNGGATESEGTLLVRQRVRLDVTVAPFLDGRVELGAALVDGYVPFGYLGHASLSGNVMSGLLSLTLGG